MSTKTNQAVRIEICPLQNPVYYGIHPVLMTILTSVIRTIVALRVWSGHVIRNLDAGNLILMQIVAQHCEIHVCTESPYWSLSSPKYKRLVKFEFSQET